MKIYIDFETRSPVDFKAHGTMRYVKDPRTEIMCLCVAVDDEKPFLFIADGLFMHIKGIKTYKLTEMFVRSNNFKSDQIIAQNSIFDYLIWNNVLTKYSYDPLPLEKMCDTQAQLAYHCLPQNLEAGGLALNLATQKNMIGHALMKKYCKPKADGTYYDDPEDLKKIFLYCGDDVEATRLIHKTLNPLPRFERKIWQIDQEINLRGVPVDVPASKAIIETVKIKEVQLLEKFQTVVNGEVSGPRSYVKLKEWVERKTGLTLDSVDKAATRELLKKDLPADVRQALEIKTTIAKSSVAKYKKIVDQEVNGRLYNLFGYYGGSTGRWAAFVVQPHNMPNNAYGERKWEEVAPLFYEKGVDDLDIFYDGVFSSASKMIRGAIKAPSGKRFICADFSGIEARGLGYLSYDNSALAVFFEGQDPYKVAASNIFGIPYKKVTKKQRLVGKVSELALGYQGGIGAYASMAKGYNIDLEILPAFVQPYSLDEMKGQFGAIALAKTYLANNPEAMSLEAAVACDVIKRRWRAGRESTVQFWHDVEGTAIAAVDQPGEVFQCNNLFFKKEGDFLKCRLPSGRNINYFLPQFRMIETPWGDNKKALTYMSMKTLAGKTARIWCRTTTYGGKLVENITQAFCRDLLALAMLRLKDAGFPIVFHVHDEIIAEIEPRQKVYKQFINIMSQVPEWAEGMPITAEGWKGKRFRK